MGITEASAQPDKRLRILMISYACSPRRGGEHLLGWNWAARLAQRGHEVLVLTASHRLQESDGYAVSGLELSPVDDHRFVWIRKLGLLGVHLYYQLWNRAAAKMARRIASERPIDVIHQCTFHTYRVPCLPALWGTMPTVWGPLAGLEQIPLRLVPALDGEIWGEVARSLGNALRKRQRTIRRCLAAADQIVVSNEDTRRQLMRIAPRRYEFIPANAVEPRPGHEYEAPAAGRLDMIAVGALVPMRPYSLVLRAIAAIPAGKRPGLSLTFIGSGQTEARLKSQVQTLGLGPTVRFLGQQPLSVTYDAMCKAHLLVFPSLRDSGSSSVAEAMSMGLPVLGFDLAGPGAMLARGGGFIMTARTRAGLVSQMHVCMERLIEDPSDLERISGEGRAAALETFDWPRRIDRIERLYRSAIAEKAEVGAGVSAANPVARG